VELGTSFCDLGEGQARRPLQIDIIRIYECTQCAEGFAREEVGLGSLRTVSMMGAAAVVDDAHSPRSPADQRQPPARCLPIPDRRCCPLSVLCSMSSANVVMDDVQWAGSLPPQQPPKSFAQNLDMLRSGGVTAGAATRRRAKKLAGDAGGRRTRQQVLKLLCLCGPAIGCREVVAAITTVTTASRGWRVDKRLAPNGA